MQILVDYVNTAPTDTIQSRRSCCHQTQILSNREVPKAPKALTSPVETHNNTITKRALAAAWRAKREDDFIFLWTHRLNRLQIKR